MGACLRGDTTPYPPGEEPAGYKPPTPYPVEVPKLQNVDYIEMVPYLHAGWQEHDQRIASLEAGIDELRAHMAALKGN